MQTSRNSSTIAGDRISPDFFKISPERAAFGSESLEKLVFRKISEYIRRPWRNKKANLIRGIQVDLSRIRWIGCAESAWLALSLDHIGRLVGGPIGLILPTDMRANAFLNRWKFLDTPAFSSGAVLIDTRSLSRYEASAGHYAAVPGMSSQLVEFKTVRIQPLQGVPSQDLPFTSLLVRIEFILQNYVGWTDRKELVHIFCDVFLRELLTNVFEHSEVDYGLIAIQIHRGAHQNLARDSLDWEKAFVAENPDYVELFVGDNGVGIEHNLGSVHAKVGSSGNPDDVLLFACQKGTTSKPLDKERKLTTRRKGMGLFYVMQRVKDWQGAFQLRSGSGLICFSHLRHSGWTRFSSPLGNGWVPAEFSGTQLKILLPASPTRRVLERLSPSL